MHSRPGATNLGLILPSLVLLVAMLPIPADAATLSSGVDPIRTPDYTLCLLSSRAVDHDTARAFAKVADEVADAATRARRLGLKPDCPVHVRIMLDLDVPCRDLWTAVGLDPDDATFELIREKLLSSYAITDRAATFRNRDWVEERFLHLQGLPLHTLMDPWEPTPDEAADFARVGAREIATYMDGLRLSLDEPLSSHPTLYRVSGENVYQPLSRFVWIRIPAGQAVHRSFGAIVHEVGHHVFDRLASRTMDQELAEGMGWSPSQRSSVMRPLMAFNELFADYWALAAGNGRVVGIRQGGPRTDESTRSFFEERTLDDFLRRSAAADGAFEECHDVLNPVRSLLGLLRHDLGAGATDRLMARTATLAVARYLTVDLPGLERSSLDIIEPGLFKVKGLPRDPESENLRALGWLLAAADEVLDPSGRTVLTGHVKAVFGRRSPVAP